MKYVFRNIRSLFQTQPMIAFLMLICVWASTVILHFSYGLYQNYNVILAKENSATSYLPLQVADGAIITKSELLECIFQLSDNVNDNVKNYYLMFDADVEGEEQYQAVSEVTCRFTVSNGSVRNCEGFREALTAGGNLRGRFFTDEEQAFGTPVAIIAPSDSGGTDVTSLKINGKQYEVIGYSFSSEVDVPIQSLNDDAKVSSFIMIVFSEYEGDMMTRSQYNEIQETFTKHFGASIIIPDLDIPEQENQYLYRTILLISVVIALLAAINFSQLFQYILDQRQQRIAIFRLCGCTAKRTIRLLLLECLMFTVPAYWLAAFLYSRLFMPNLTPLFPYMADSFTPILYIALFGIYLVSILTVLVIMLHRRIARVSIVSLERKHSK